MAKLTNNQKLWLEQSTNILARINRLHEQGVDTSNIPKPPKKPKTVTQKQIQGLKKISEQITEYERKAKEHQQEEVNTRIKKYLEEDNAKKIRIKRAQAQTGAHSIAWDLYVVIKDALEKASASNGKGTNMLIEFVEMLEETYGQITTASIFYNAYKEGVRLTSEILYDSDGSKATPFISQITRFIKNKEDYDIFRDKVIELFEYYDTLEMSELDEEQNV